MTFWIGSPYEELARYYLAETINKAQAELHKLDTKEVLFEEQNAEAVAWNTEIPDMLCFSAHGTLSIKTGNFPLHQQRMQGVVVGFKVSRAPPPTGPDGTYRIPCNLLTDNVRHRKLESDPPLSGSRPQG